MWILKSVSNPNESIIGSSALTVYNGDPGFGISLITCPLLLYNTNYNASKQSAEHYISDKKNGSIILGDAIKKEL